MTGIEVSTLRGIFAQIGGRLGRWSCCAAIAGLLMSVASGCSESGVAREPHAAMKPSQTGNTSALAATPVTASPRKVATRSAAVRANGVRHLGESLTSKTVPAWAADAVFYQIFPERFCNGDRSNDPTRDSLESPDLVSSNWGPPPSSGS